MSLLYQTAQILVSLIGYPLAVWLPVLLVVVVIYRQIRKMRFDLLVVVAVFSMAPMLVPLLTDALGYQYFTMMNFDLQADPSLKVAGILLIALFTVSLFLGSAVPVRFEIGIRERVSFPFPFVVAIFAMNFVLFLLFLESGTIVESGYADIKEIESPYSSLVNQFFNVCACILLVKLRPPPRRLVTGLILAGFFVLCLLMARRTLAVGITILLFYIAGRRKFTWQQIASFAVVAFLLWFVGEVRAIGLVEYFAGTRLVGQDLFYSMPGGGSNVFLSTMGVIHMLQNVALEFPETYPIFTWFSGVTEGKIYETKGYQYNGGMHIATVLYWNFGLLGVALGGLFFGQMTRLADFVLQRIGGDYEATLPAMLATAYVLVLTNTLWYSPIGLIKLAIAVFAGYFIAIALKRLR